MSEMVSTKLDRVRDHTSAKSNIRIDRHIEDNIRKFAGQPFEVLTTHINELDKEWDIERRLETNASIIAFIGTILGAFVNPWFLVIPALVTAFLFQHATQGWCPPLPIFRKFGKRTRKEIDTEKFAMKILRGDFNQLQFKADKATLAEQVIEAVKSF
jgi:hypothetical protein